VRALYCGDNETAKEIVMSDDVRDEPLQTLPDSPAGAADHAGGVDGPPEPSASGLGRRALLQSLASGVGMAVLATPAVAHVHQAAAAAAKPAAASARAAASTALVFLDRHAFDTLAMLADQIVPGAKAAKVPEFLDRLLAVETTETQKRFVQAIGAFEREARTAHRRAWKALTPAQSTAILETMSKAPATEGARRAFEVVKSGVADTFFATQAGMKELGWNGGVMFATPVACS